MSTHSDHQEGSWFISQGNVSHHTICDKMVHFHLFILISKAGPVSGLGLFLQHQLPVLDVLSVWQLFGIAYNLTTECNITIVNHVFMHSLSNDIVLYFIAYKDIGNNAEKNKQ